MKKSSKRETNWQDYKAKILSALDLRAEFESLGLDVTGRDPGKDGWIECRAYDRDDNDPSAAVNLSTGWYKDLGGDGRALSFWDLAVATRRYPDWKTARDAYAAKAGVSLNGGTPRDPAEHLAFMAWNPALVSLWCRHKPGVTPEAVQAAGGRLARYRDQYTVIALPVYGPALTEAEPVGWVLYNTTGRELPIFHGKDKTTGEPKISWKKMKTTGGSETGLIGRHALEKIQANPAADFVLWKVEGPSDLLALWSAIPADRRDRHLIVTNAGGSNEIPKSWMANVFAGRMVAVLHDADAPGQSGADKWAGWAAKVAAEVRRPSLPYEIQADHGKDLRDYLNEGHTYTDLLKLVDAAESVVDGPAGQSVTASSERPANVQPTSSESEASAADDPTTDTEAIEADDDPHRLARVNLKRYATTNEGRTLRFWRDEWYVWKRNRYTRITTNELRAKLSAAIKDEFDRLNIERQANATADGQLPTAHKVTQAIVSNVMQATSGMVCLSPEIELGTWLPARERRSYISMANGILDIDAFMRDAELDECLRPNTPKWFSTVTLPYSFDPDAMCPKWEAFLENNLEMDPERIKILQEWAGYLLLPDTSEQRFMILEGEGANGKSVYIAGLTALLGEDNVSAIPLEVFGDRFSRTDTLGKLLNAAGDCGELDKAAEGYLKSLSGGDRMFFDRKGVSGINCRPTARLMIACNNRPRFSDRSQGLWRRMLLIPWRVEIEKAKRIRGMDKIEFWQRSGELPGMLNWALIGLARLRAQQGFTDSQLMEDALRDYQEETNPARVFLTQHLEPSTEGKIKSGHLYDFYVRWSKQNGHFPLAERSFGKEVRRVFHNVERLRGGGRSDRYWFYKGLDFSQDEIYGADTTESKLF